MISGEASWRSKGEFGENFYLIKVNQKRTKVSHIVHVHKSEIFFVAQGKKKERK